VKNQITVFVFAVVLMTWSCNPYKSVIKEMHLKEGLYAEIKTTKGSIFIELAYDKAPLTVASFVGLAEGTIENKIKKPGEPYFDGLIFHRVAPNFVIQGGDPMGNGRGGPGYQFRQEIHPELKHDSAGVVAMANSGPNTNGSQFYITLQPTNMLDGDYNVFGSVVKGMDVVRNIGIGDEMTTIRVFRLGRDAKAFKARETFEHLK
jgi:peptidylprolyl isomerase